MVSESSCLPKPRRRPSETGLNADEMERYVGVLRSREEARAKLREFIEEASASENPLVALVVAEWGEGKTSLFYTVLNKLQPPQAASFIVSGRTVISFLERIASGAVAPQTASVAHGFLASVLAALFVEQLEAIERKCGSRPSPIELSSFSRCEDYVPRALEELHAACNCSKIFVFVDEFEDIVSASPRVVEYAVSGITHLLNGAVREISSRSDVGKGRYAGWLHLVLSLTPSAYTKLRGFGELSSIIARFSRRVKLIELKPLPRSEALALLRGLCRYIFDGVELESVLRPCSLVNPLIVASLGNPAALQRAFTELVYLKAASSSECFTPITFSEAIELVKRISIDIAGAKLPLAVESSIEKLRRVVSRVSKLAGGSKALELLDLALATLVIEPSDAKSLLGISDADLEDSVHTINAAARAPQLSFATRILYAAELIPWSEEARERAVDAWRKALSTCPSTSSDPSTLAEIIVESSTYVDSRGGLAIAVPMKGEEGANLVKELVPTQLSSDEAALLLSVLSRELSSLERRKALILSPRIVSTIYVSPELTFLSFVKGVDRRFRYWRELISSIRDEHLLLGFVAAMSTLRSVLKVRRVEVL
ncbi:MAG: hypothetical protein GXO32_03940 [Crenarchaeota archaeon]|nr:hypothetical protein [Thermoproteota archaeon]